MGCSGSGVAGSVCVHKGAGVRLVGAPHVFSEGWGWLLPSRKAPMSVLGHRGSATLDWSLGSSSACVHAAEGPPASTQPSTHWGHDSHLPIICFIHKSSIVTSLFGISLRLPMARRVQVLGLAAAVDLEVSGLLIPASTHISLVSAKPH